MAGCVCPGIDWSMRKITLGLWHLKQVLSVQSLVSGARTHCTVGVKVDLVLLRSQACCNQELPINLSLLALWWRTLITLLPYLQYLWSQYVADRS